MGSNLAPFPSMAEAGGSNTEQSLSTLIRVGFSSSSRNGSEDCEPPSRLAAVIR
jgi:hypothetical protein